MENHIKCEILNSGEIIPGLISLHEINKAKVAYQNVMKSYLNSHQKLSHYNAVI